MKKQTQTILLMIKLINKHIEKETGGKKIFQNSKQTQTFTPPKSTLLKLFHPKQKLFQKTENSPFRVSSVTWNRGRESSVWWELSTMGHHARIPADSSYCLWDSYHRSESDPLLVYSAKDWRNNLGAQSERGNPIGRGGPAQCVTSAQSWRVANVIYSLCMWRWSFEYVHPPLARGRGGATSRCPPNNFWKCRHLCFFRGLLFSAEVDIAGSPSRFLIGRDIFLWFLLERLCLKNMK